MKVWVDKQGGSHFHSENCWMVKDPEPHYHYESVEKRLRTYIAFGRRMYHDIRVDGKTYRMCSCMMER